MAEKRCPLHTYSDDVAFAACVREQCSWFTSRGNCAVLLMAEIGAREFDLHDEMRSMAEKEIGRLSAEIDKMEGDE